MSAHSTSLPAVFVLLAAAALGAACGVARGEAPPTGQELYAACKSCHGDAGGGNAAIGAPSIAGMPRWYVASQLHRFQDGVRGKHPDDIEGMRMRAMSRQMLNKAEIDAVSGYVAGLTPVPHAPMVTSANPAAAAPLFITCTGCHGPKGEGQEPMNAPPLARLEDWYIARQLTKFQQHVRGSAAGDSLGMQMQAMSMTVPPNQVNDVAAYIHQTLSK